MDNYLIVALSRKSNVFVSWPTHDERTLAHELFLPHKPQVVVAERSLCGADTQADFQEQRVIRLMKNPVHSLVPAAKQVPTQSERGKGSD